MIAIWHDPIVLRHDTGQHPETGQRLVAIRSALDRAEFAEQIQWHTATPARIETIQLNHDPDYMRSVEQAINAGVTALDADTIVSADSWQAAVAAVGAVTEAVDMVMNGKITRTFCAVRPPGHHAEQNRALGFCIFNNVAIGARHAISAHNLERVAIIDFDVHHGNGTQNSFYDNPSVFYISLHQWPGYPGSGEKNETGTGAGEGTTLNIPLPYGTTDEAYAAAFDNKIMSALRRYRPELIFISAGFDAHSDDPLAGMMLTDDGFAMMTRKIAELSDELEHGRIVSVLEGGYDLDALGRSVSAHIAALLTQ